MATKEPCGRQTDTVKDTTTIPIDLVFGTAIQQAKLEHPKITCIKLTHHFVYLLLLASCSYAPRAKAPFGVDFDVSWQPPVFAQTLRLLLDAESEMISRRTVGNARCVCVILIVVHHSFVRNRVRVRIVGPCFSKAHDERRLFGSEFRPLLYSAPGSHIWGWKSSFLKCAFDSPALLSTIRYNQLGRIIE